MGARRKLMIGFGLGILSPIFAALAQQSKVRRIGFLAARSRSTSSNPDVYCDAFVQGMRELGYIEGKNLVIEWRFADGKYERLPGLAAELVQMKVDVIVSHMTPGTQALQWATTGIAIVMTSIIDTVGSGFAASLARPGGNITGLSIMMVDVSPKQRPREPTQIKVTQPFNKVDATLSFCHEEKPKVHEGEPKRSKEFQIRAGTDK